MASAMRLPVLFPFLLLLVTTLAGCAAVDGDGSAPGAGLVPLGTSASYHASYRLDQGFEVQDLRFLWSHEVPARDPFGAPKEGVLLEVATDGSAMNGGIYDPRSGQLAAEGIWSGEKRIQGFVHRAADWTCYPGLLMDPAAGLDLIRSWIFPIHCLSPLVRDPDRPDDLSLLDVPLEVRTLGPDRYEVRHADAARPEADGPATIRHVLEYRPGDGVPAKATAHLQLDGKELLIWELTRTAYRPGDGTWVPWPTAGMGSLDTLELHPWEDVPPTGNPSELRMSLEAAMQAVRDDVRSRDYLARHPDAILRSAQYREPSPEETPGPTGDDVKWLLRYTDPQGQGLIVDVRRNATPTGLLLPPAVVAVEEEQTEPAPRWQVPPPLVSLDALLPRADTEVRFGTPGRSVIYDVSLQPRLWGSDAAVTWRVQEDVGLRVIPPPNQVEFSAITGATLQRAQFS